MIIKDKKENKKEIILDPDKAWETLGNWEISGEQLGKYCKEDPIGGWETHHQKERHS
jgi:hypothetical protein